MTVDDRARLNLHRTLEAVLGHEEADTLMSHLPPVTWNQVATNDDLDTLSTTLRSETRALGAELRAEMHTLGTELRSEMNAMGAELRSEMNTMGAEMRTEVQVGVAGLRAEFVEGTNRQIKWMVTFAAVWSSLLVTVVGLIS